jgi:hypothetical protein
MPINFPTGATTNQVYTYNNLQWQWNGSSWITYTPTVATINAATGGTYSNGTITLSGLGNLSPITGIPQGTITSVTETNNTFTVSSNNSSNSFTIDAVTGGTYSNGAITLGGSGSINTIITGIPTGSTSSGGGGTVWYGSTTSVTAVTNTGYITTATTLTTITLPTNPTLGFSFEVVGNGTGLWRINQNTGQTIRFGIVSTTPTSGIISATTQYDAIRLVCTTANTEFTVLSALGNLFYN